MSCQVPPAPGSPRATVFSFSLYTPLFFLLLLLSPSFLSDMSRRAAQKGYTSLWAFLLLSLVLIL